MSGINLEANVVTNSPTADTPTADTPTGNAVELDVVERDYIEWLVAERHAFEVIPLMSKVAFFDGPDTITNKTGVPHACNLVCMQNG